MINKQCVCATLLYFISVTLRLKNGSIDELNPEAHNATIATVLHWGSM